MQQLDLSEKRVRRRGKFWGVQERKRWLWRWIGPFGISRLGRWPTFAEALWFANLCDRVDRKGSAA